MFPAVFDAYADREEDGHLVISGRRFNRLSRVLRLACDLRVVADGLEEELWPDHHAPTAQTSAPSSEPIDPQRWQRSTLALLEELQENLRQLPLWLKVAQQETGAEQWLRRQLEGLPGDST